MTQQPLAHTALPEQKQTSMSGISMRRVGVATSIWGVVFAVVHFYWAADGSIGTNGKTPSLAASLYIAFIAVLGLLGAVVAHGLSQRWGERLERRLVLLARVGGTALLAGVAGGVAPWIAAGSIGDNDGTSVAASVTITAYFLIGGLLFSTLGWRHSLRARALSGRKKA
jgi:hypothetical protein